MKGISRLLVPAPQVYELQLYSCTCIYDKTRHLDWAYLSIRPIVCKVWYIGTLPYYHFVNMTTPLLRLPFYCPKMNWKSSHYLSFKTSFIRPPRYWNHIFTARRWLHQRGSTVYIIDSTHKLLIQVLLERPLDKQLGCFISDQYCKCIFNLLFYFKALLCILN